MPNTVSSDPSVVPVAPTSQDVGTTGGSDMVGPEGQVAQAPATIKIGPDGEPEPVGNEAQRRAAEAIAATFNKDVADRLNGKKEEAKPEQVQPKPNKQGGLSPEQMQNVLNDQGAAANDRAQEMQRQAQDEANRRYNEITKAGQTQSTPGATPVEQSNSVGPQNVQIQGQGTVQ